MLHRLRLEEGAVADEEIVLGQQRDEIQPELPRRRLDAEGRIRHVARDEGCDRRVGELQLRLLHGGGVDVMQFQQLVEHLPRAGIVVAVYEARLVRDEILERVDFQWTAALRHQAHFAGDEADNAILLRVEPFEAGADVLLAQRTARQMDARQIAGILCE
ncbi:hypothetical protein BN961_00507 [Afipia felis]|uniref:Uncharacterized protein n=1 Tax=Afipia felis TaxID=1035 RepID=A0A090MHV7_AFIFE|nr:hypothetical protein BN961_00507 [Afipia felis]